VTSVRFGFREVWFEGRRFLFNGRNAKLTRTGYNPFSQGHMNRPTLRAMVASGDVRAGVIWAGVVASYPDLLERWRRSSSGPGTPTPTPRGWRGTLVETYGSPQENPQFWQSISANAYLQDLSGPVQLHHGTADTSVPLEFSILLNEQIQAAGGTVEFYEYPGDNHNLSNYFSSAMQRSVEFFDRFVKGN